MTRLLATEEPNGMSRTALAILFVLLLLGVVGGIVVAFYLGYLSTFGR